MLTNHCMISPPRTLTDNQCRPRSRRCTDAELSSPGAPLAHGSHTLRTHEETPRCCPCFCSYQAGVCKDQSCQFGAFKSFTHTTTRSSRFLEHQEATYNEHRNKQVLLGDLSMREDVVQHGIHITLILFPKGKDALVIVTCNQKRTFFQTPHLCVTENKLLGVSFFFYIYVLRIYFAWLT